LNKARLRLGISPEIRDAYSEKFGVPFFVLPPLIERALLPTEPLASPGRARRAGALVGNLWSQKWLDRLRETVRRSGLTLEWYGNTGAAWLRYSADELAADGIIPVGFLPEQELVSRL